MAQVDHWAVIGPTKCGKSNLVKWYAKERRKQGIPVLVCDPIGDPSWRKYATWVTDDPFRLLAKAKASNRCILVFDEGGEYLTNTAKALPLKWFATAARHRGHQSIFMAQKSTAIPPTYRSNAGTIFLFGCTEDEAETCSSDFVCKGLLAAPKLPRFNYLEFTRFGTLKLGKTPNMDAVEKPVSK